MSELSAKLWVSNVSPLTNQAARRIEELETALDWIRTIADSNLEQDNSLRSNGARTLRRVADKCDEVLK